MPENTTHVKARVFWKQLIKICLRASAEINHCFESALRRVNHLNVKYHTVASLSLWFPLILCVSKTSSLSVEPSKVESAGPIEIFYTFLLENRNKNKKKDAYLSLVETRTARVSSVHNCSALLKSFSSIGNAVSFDSGSLGRRVYKIKLSLRVTLYGWERSRAK